MDELLVTIYVLKYVYVFWENLFQSGDLINRINPFNFYAFYTPITRKTPRTVKPSL